MTHAEEGPISDQIVSRLKAKTAISIAEMLLSRSNNQLDEAFALACVTILELAENSSSGFKRVGSHGSRQLLSPGADGNLPA